MSYTIGELATIKGKLYDAGGVPVSPSAYDLVVTDPDGTETPYDDLTATSDGGAAQDVLLSKIGTWRWRMTTEGVVDAKEGTLECESIYQGAVSDIRDLRVLVPACRRAIDGPQATAPDSPSTTLSDTEVLNLIADATGELILQTHGHQAFGYQLVVVARDPFYKAPNAWATDQERAPAADAAILSQAALNHYFWLIKLMKVSETVKNEAVDWSYSLSASVISQWMTYLMANRDKAIEALQVINAPLDVYISLVAERDRMAAAWLEPWVAEVGAPVPYAGGGGSGPLEFDYRFSTWG